jgi:drug/metabolite transporter (DMT)-like permease
MLVKHKTPARTGIDWRLVFAFLAIYVVWGSSFLGIRILVETVPPLFAAGLRFTIAGGLLYGWARMRGATRPTKVEWRSLAILGFLMFFVCYSALFWAETAVPSGVASILAATLPVWTVLFEVLVFRKVRLPRSVFAAIAVGFAGAALVTYGPAGRALPLLPCLAILGGELAWGLGSVLSGSLRLPKSMSLTAGAEMLVGGLILLAGSFAKGELHPWPHISLPAGFALAYLIVFPSLVTFTAFVWLLGRMPATRVATHAYVNPVVALMLGRWVAGEVFGWNTLLGASLVLVSVVLILRVKAPAH